MVLSCKHWFTKYLHTVIFCLIFCSKISDKYQISISDINQVIDITTTLFGCYETNDKNTRSTHDCPLTSHRLAAVFTDLGADQPDRPEHEESGDHQRHVRVDETAAAHPGRVGQVHPQLL